MSGVALWLLVAYGAVALLFRMVVQLRLTGSTGFRGISGGSPVEALGGALFVAALVLLVVAARADVDQIAVLDQWIPRSAPAWSPVARSRWFATPSTRR